MNTSIIPAGHLAAPGVYAYDMESLPWRETPRGTAREKAVRRDAEAGLFLHQHQGTASSYFLSGSLVDYQGTTSQGAIGINLRGATHDAVTYTGATLVSRLEGPVTIPQGGLRSTRTPTRRRCATSRPRRRPTSR
jgi:hypothetical protein